MACFLYVWKNKFGKGEGMLKGGVGVLVMGG